MNLARIGTLSLDRVGRCPTRSVDLLRVTCSRRCEGDVVGEECVIMFVWSMLLRVGGKHNGCDRPGYVNPGPPPDRSSCPACGSGDCDGRLAWESPSAAGGQ